MVQDLSTYALAGTGAQTVQTETLLDFSKAAKDKGFSRVLIQMKLGKKADGTPKYPKIAFVNETTNAILPVTFAKNISEGVEKGLITQKDLFGLQVVFGKNAKGEPRLYLSSKGEGGMSIDAMIEAILAWRPVMVLSDSAA